jgi:ornithine carbamoyltransferase
MDLISITDLAPGEILEILDRADALKAARNVTSTIFAGKSLAMIFEKPSTRTRVSLEVAMTDFGGHALYLGRNDLQLGRGETIADTARVLSRYVHGIVARVYDHETVAELAANADVPVINALSNLEHPCQILADLMTMREHFGALEGLRVAWIGDGNNVCNSTVLACALLGMELRVASPPGFGPKSQILEEAKRQGGSIMLTLDPAKAAMDADVIETDTWISMGDEAEEAKRLKAFTKYQVNSDLVELARSDAIVMHCLPAHRGKEITDEVMDGPHSAILDQSENRLHTTKAVLEKLIAH